MSLQVWLPLISNLNNQGCGAATISAPSTTFTLQKGKIGNASYTSSSTITINLPSIASSRIWSVTFWAYAVSANITANWIRVIRIADGGDMFRVEVCPSSYNSGQNCYSTHNNAAYKIAQGSVGSPSGGYYDQWFHMAITCDGTTISVYHNGILRGTQNYTGDGAITGYFYIENSDKTYKNDFRVYDECLSPKQVKEISKGLVLHLPCDGGGRGANNLVNGSNTNSVDTNGFGYSEQTGGSTRTIEYDGGVPCVKITRNTTAHSGWDCFWYNKFRISEIKVNTTYVVSFDAIGSGSGSIGLSGFVNGNGTNTITESVTTVSNSFNASTWSHIQFITKTKSSFDGISVGSQVVYMSCGFLRTVSTWVKLKNMKVTEGATESSWMPSVSDTAYAKMGYDKGIEYDTSGYSRHGVMKNGTYAGNQARYSACASLLGTTVDTTSNTITGAQWFVAPITLAQTKYITFAWWSKGVSYGRGGIFCTTNSISGDVPNTDYNTTAVCNWDSTFRLYTVGGTAFNFWTQYSNAVSDNTWHHHVITYDGTTARYYQDGVQKNSAAISSEIPAFSGICMGLGRAGGVYRQIKEYANDVRIYVTALSADDIKELYQVSASVDNKGNILGYDFSEN